MHKARGWKCCGYHYYITRDGQLHMGRPEETDPKKKKFIKRITPLDDWIKEHGSGATEPGDSGSTDSGNQGTTPSGGSDTPQGGGSDTPAGGDTTGGDDGDDTNGQLP